MDRRKKAVICLVVFAIIIGGAALYKYVKKQKIDQELERLAQNRQDRGQEVIRMVKDSEIGQGVSLLDGVVAYCGTSGEWSVFGNSVFLKAYGDRHWIEASFEVDLETGNVDIFDFDSDTHPTNIEEVEKVLHDMILAAKQ